MDRKKQSTIPTLKEILNAKKEFLSGTSPIFKRNLEGALKISIAENYIDYIFASGSTPQELEIFDKFINGLVQWLTVHSAIRRNLLISGPPGIGKTALMTALYRTILKSGLYPRMISAKDLGDIYRGRIQFHGWKEINDYNILFLDDVGMEDELINDFGNKTMPMIRLLHNRYDRNLITVFTTNLTWEQICARYSDRVADRLSNYHRLVYERESFRGRRING